MIVSGLGFGSTGAISRTIDADTWQIASWRGLIGGTGALAYVTLRGRRPKLRTTLGPQGLLLTALAALSMILYIDALQRTEVANVAVISATIPFMAAALAWLILREQLRRSTVVAAVVALVGVTLTVAGNLGPGDLDGNLRAVVLALVLALLIVLIRRFEGADAVLALGSAGCCCSWWPWWWPTRWAWPPTRRRSSCSSGWCSRCRWCCGPRGCG